MEPERKPPRTTTWVPNRNPLQTQGLPTSRITTREVPHKQNYDHGGSLQAELRPGSLPTSRITTRELAGWLALAGWLRPREAQRGPERPREAQRGGAGIEQACHAFGWKLPTSRLTTREAPQRFLYGTREEAATDYYEGSKQKSTSNPGPPHKQNYDQGCSPQAEPLLGSPKIDPNIDTGRLQY